MSRKQIYHTSTLVFIFIILHLTSNAIYGQRAVFGDYFGTGKTDYLSIGISSGGNYVWDVLRNPVTNPSQTSRTIWGSFSPTGMGGDFLLQGDWDGDLKTDIGIWRPGNLQNQQSFFYIQPSSNPNSIIGVAWGKSISFPNNTDFPVTGDFDGDGKDDFAVTRREGGQKVWYILPSGGGNYRRIVFGLDTDSTIVSMFDFNNDGRDDLGVFRISQSGEVTHYIGDAQTGNLILAQQWGNVSLANGRIFYGNYIGDSRADIVNYYGVCEASFPNCGVEGTFWIKETGSDNFTVTKWGIPADFGNLTGDRPDFGDYDGDGRFDISVFRPSNSTYYTILSSNGQFQFQQWSGLGNSVGINFGFLDEFNQNSAGRFSLNGN